MSDKFFRRAMLAMCVFGMIVGVVGLIIFR